MAGRAAYAHLVHLRDLYDGVALLMDRAQAHGAWVLGRSMFETSLMLGALEDEDSRDAIVHRWFLDSNVRSRGFVKALAEAGIDADIGGLEQLLSDDERRLNAARDEMNVKNLPQALQPETEAAHQGRREDIPNYRTAHAFTHGAYSALKYRITNLPGTYS